MTIRGFIGMLTEKYPLSYAEDFDNVGLLVGDYTSQVKGVLITLDTTEDVLDEAIENDANVILSYHPIIFDGLKKIIGRSYAERAVIKSIKYDINIIAIHTALDNSIDGINSLLFDKLNIEDRSILISKKGTLQKLTTYVPQSNLEALREKLFDVGAGALGNYKNCSYTSKGEGTFLGNSQSNPTKGTRGILHREKEIQLNLVFESHLKSDVLKTLLKHHPYEEPAYEIITLENNNQPKGMGLIGNLKRPTNDVVFLKKIMGLLNQKVIKHSQLLNKPITKIGFVAGSGSFAIESAFKKGVEVFLSSDISYHHFFKYKNKILIVDIGHYESEQLFMTFMFNFISNKIPKLAVSISNVSTNPINYYFYDGKH